jgi:YVTN family beta-propeller protein
VAVNATGSPYAGDVYVTNQGSNTVSVIDPVFNSVVTTITVGSAPFGVAVSATPNAGYAYIANQGSNSVSVINPVFNSVVATITVGTFPFGVAVA